MKKLLLALFVIAGLSVGSVAQEMPSEGMKGEGKKMMHHKKKKRTGLYKYLKDLNLTSEQKSQLKAFRDKHKGEMMKRKGEFLAKKHAHKAQELNFATFMSKDSFDTVAFKKEMRTRFETMRKMMEERRESMIEARAKSMENLFNILTPAQRAKLLELSKKQ
jgi:Spy/CpxP family protein refolding chaperone